MTIGNDIDGPLVLAGQMEIAAQSSRDRPVVELKCVTKLGEVGAGDAKPCVDFFAGVGPWIAERKHSVGTDLGAARSDGRVSNRDIAVFDDEMARAIRSRPSSVCGSRSTASSSVRCISRCTADCTSWRLPGK